MKQFDPEILKQLYRPSKDSHKGQNGKLTIVGGSKLFHGASLWALKISSRIVDMVFYASTEENNQLSQDLKSKVYDFIAVPRSKVGEYIEESDVILVGSGMPRPGGKEESDDDTKDLTEEILEQAANDKKKLVLDAGALQTIDSDLLKTLNGNVILTPHHKEFQALFDVEASEESIKWAAEKYNCVILLKGKTDIISSPTQQVQISGGNEGMTKGGTGDVLAGLTAALACKNDLFLAAQAASYINKKAGDSLYEKVGTYFNASDLCDEIPKVMHTLLS